jgi:hypothetical protein
VRIHNNIDGFFFAGDRIGGWGFFIRDSNGEMLATDAGNIVYVALALQTEALADSTCNTTWHDEYCRRNECNYFSVSPEICAHRSKSSWLLN